MIFLSYRRGDTAGHAGRLFDRLAGRFGRDRVFMDVDTIQPGEDFARAIAAQVGSCDVLLALIGDQWLSATDSTGRRRIDDPADFVRVEIAAALERRIPVIPVLVEGARMPSAGSLPEDIRDLVRMQALEISDTRFDSEALDLIHAVARYLPKKVETGLVRGIPRRLALAGAVTVVGVAAVGWVLWRKWSRQPGLDLSGRWIAEVEDPGRDPFKVVLDLQSVGSDVLGTVTYPTGSGSIRDGRVEGSRVSFATDHVAQFENRPSTIRFVLEIEGKTLRGSLITEERSRVLTARREGP